MIQLQNYSRLSFKTYCLVCFVSGFASALAMAPFNIWGVLFITIPTLYIGIATYPSKKRAFILGWLFGFGYFLTGLYWIGNALLVEGNDYAWAWPLAVLGLPFALAFFFGAAGLLIAYCAPLKNWQGYLAFTASLTATEWLRGHIFTGFPWNLFGYTWADTPPILQMAYFGDVYSLTALTVLWASLPGFILISDHKNKAAQRLIMIVVFSILVCLALGTWRLSQAPQNVSEAMNIRVVQPNIAQSEKWDRDKIWQHFEKTLRLSEQTPEDDTNQNPTIIVWPETAIGPWVLNDPVAMGDIKALLNQYNPPATLITGALRHEGPGTPYYNSIITINPDGSISGIYDKHHLVPFGEYIPFQDYIPLEPIAQFSGFEAGSGPTVIEGAAGFFYSPAICYEIIFSGNISPPNNISPSPQAIITVTNDAWYGDSPGPYQHFTSAKFRAIEEGLPVIRSANNGISGTIDIYGKEIFLTDLDQTTTFIKKLPVSAAKSDLHKFFSSILLFTFVFTAFGFCIRRKS